MIIFTKKLLLEFYHSSSFCGNASAKVQTSLETRPLIWGCCVCRSQHGGAGAGQGEGEDCEGTACLVCGVWAAGRAPCCRRHAVERAGFFSSNSPLWCFSSSPAVPAACWPDVPGAEVGATLLTCAPVSLGCPSSRQAPSFSIGPGELQPSLFSSVADIPTPKHEALGAADALHICAPHNRDGLQL